MNSMIFQIIIVVCGGLITAFGTAFFTTWMNGIKQEIHLSYIKSELASIKASLARISSRQRENVVEIEKVKAEVIHLRADKK